MDGSLEVIAAVVDLYAVLHGRRAVDSLNVEADDFGRFGANRIAAHLNVDAQRDAPTMVEDFAMEASGPTRAMFVEAGAEDARFAHLVMRLQAGIRRL
jgi:hypothetical protein